MKSINLEKVMSIKPHLLKNDNLTYFFKNFFGPNVVSAYICVTQETDQDNSIIFQHDSMITEHFSNITGCMVVDANCDFVLELNFGIEHKYLEITLAEQFSPMIFSKFSVNDAVIVQR